VITDKGYFDKFIAIDCATSGINRDADNPSKDYQSVSWGIIVASVKDFKPIDGLYTEIKWNGMSKWDPKAEEVHGLSKDYLNKNGVTEAEAAEEIGGLLFEHFGIDVPITLLGHNVVSFDLPFLKKLLHSNDLLFKFSNRHMDTFSLAMGTVQTYNSDDLFDLMGCTKRGIHNALDDANFALKTYQIINKIWKTYV